VSSATSARKRSLAAAGHHAMTAISHSVNRYPLFTVFVKVAAMWTVGKSEARQMSREEQTSLVLVPVRFMVRAGRSGNLGTHRSLFLLC
jgi:hypothetical protein